MIIADRLDALGREDPDRPDVPLIELGQTALDVAADRALENIIPGIDERPHAGHAALIQKEHFTGGLRARSAHAPADEYAPVEDLWNATFCPSCIPGKAPTPLFMRQKNVRTLPPLER